MESEMYYVNDPRTDNCCNLSVPLKVNCTGYFYNYCKPFAIKERKRRDWYLQIVKCGKLLNGDTEIMQEGHFILRDPESIYRYTAPEESDMGFYWLHFTGSFVQTLLEENKLPVNKVCALKTEYMHGIEHAFSRLFREFILRRPGYENMAISLLAEILVRLSRGSVEDLPEGGRRSLCWRLEQSTTYIHNHFREPLLVSDLARLEHLSDSHYREVFREAFDMSPRDYITHQRILCACSLLQNTDLSVLQVADACGYQDPLYFSRIFRKKMGVSPVEYRKKVDP